MHLVNDMTALEDNALVELSKICGADSNPGWKITDLQSEHDSEGTYQWFLSLGGSNKPNNRVGFQWSSTFLLMTSMIRYIKCLTDLWMTEKGGDN